jgi:hypothetical protein
VRYLTFLSGVHAALQPPTYLEIGIRNGDSLALSRAQSIGVDPDFNLRAELDAPVTLARTTSDEFFARSEPLTRFGGEPAALSFIDGMHLFEYVLRDFVNVERHSEWWSVVVFDDILPRTVDEAARERETRAWTGDVYKILPVLARERPDLVCLRIDTEPTGLLLVLGADPSSDALASRVDALTEEWVQPDPQDVPQETLDRVGAADPEAVLAAPFWQILREGRERRTDRETGLAQLRRSLEQSLPDAFARRGRLRDVAGRLRGTT